MGDYISRQAAIDELNGQIEYCDKALRAFDIAVNDAYAVKVERASLIAYKEQLEALPAADVVQVRHGKWFSDIFCSECGWVNEVEPGFIGGTKGFNFCPNCGAKMDAQREE